jgi:hypothetical protein
MGIVEHPLGGGKQFIGGIAQPSPGFARAQRDFAWTRHEFTISYDVNHRFLGQFAEQNLGSWSLQPSMTNIAGQDLHRWDDTFNPTTWQLTFNLFDASGGLLQQQLPGPEWMGLSVNHWYRVEHSISFISNRWTKTSLTDLHSNVTHTFMPTDWYMSGGVNPTLDLPTGSRFFAGGLSFPGNAMAVDNFTIVPEPSTLCTVSGVLIAMFSLRSRIPKSRQRVHVSGPK